MIDKKQIIGKYNKLIVLLMFLTLILIIIPTYLLQGKYYSNTQIEIIATGEKNMESNSYEVWIQEIEINEENIDLSGIELCDGWEFKEGLIYSANDKERVSLVIPAKKMHSAKITFQKHNWCGIVEIKSKSYKNRIDLFPSDMEHKISVEFVSEPTGGKQGFSLFSLEFIILLIFVALVYFWLGKINLKYQWIVLLITSYLFYATAGIIMLLPILITTVMTWLGAIIIEKIAEYYKELIKGKGADEKKKIKALAIHRKRSILALIVILNLGILIVFKYTNFFIENINMVSGSNINRIEFLIPLGLSFYTFQSVGYLIDIYRGKYKADKNLFQFALFVSYFPQIIQGPISRYDQLASQLYEGHLFHYERVKFGIQRMLWGYFKKMVIADRVAVFVNEVFSAFSNTTFNDAGYSGITVFLAALLYGVQIYADFSGGMDIVIGISQIFGIELIENFKHPFMAKSVAEFWQRWHITLGAWMRDYLFYPLALSKPFGYMAKKLRKLCGNYIAKILPTCLASFIVFFLVGVWHGADWKYIIYGIYQAAFVSTATLLEPFYARCRGYFKVNVQCYSWRVFQILRTVLLVTIGRYYSRADSAEAAFKMLKATISEFNPWVLFDGSLYTIGLDQKNFLFMLVSIAFLFIIDFIQERGIHLRNEIAKFDIVLRWTIYFAGIFSIIVFGMYGLGYDSANFIYQGF